MRICKIIGLTAFLAGLSLVSHSASAGVIDAVLTGSPVTFSSGSTVNLDLASSYFDFSVPIPDGGNTYGIIDQFMFDFGDGSVPTSWLSTPYASHTFVGAAGTIFDVTGVARWSGAPYDVGTAQLFLTVSNNVNVAAIPEPETYAMMLAGLALLGFTARRREKQVA